MENIQKNTTLSQRNPTFQLYSNKCNQPTSTKPIKVNYIDNYGKKTILSSPAHDLTCNNRNNGDLTIRDHLKSLPSYIQDHTNNTSLPSNIKEIIRAIRQNTAIAVVDGSFSPKQKLGTFCWILCTSDTSSASIKGWGQTPG